MADSSTYKEILRIFKWQFESSTVHGLLKISKTKNLIIRIVWILSFIAASIYLILNLARNFVTFFNFGVINQINFVRKPRIEFPTVTFCNRNPFKIQNRDDFALKNKFDQIYEEFLSDSRIRNSTNIFNQFLLIEYMTRNGRYDLNISEEAFKDMGYTIDDMLISCVYDNKVCQAEDFEYLFTYSFGNCYKFNSGMDRLNRPKPILTSTTPGRRNALKLELYIGQPSERDLIRSYGGVFFIHNSSTIPLSEIEGIRVSPGYETDMTIKQIIASKQSHPFSNCIKDIQSENSFNSDSYRATVRLLKQYRQKYCQQLCYQAYIIRRCRCYDRTIPYFRNETPCSTIGDLNCQNSASLAFIRSVSRSRCFNECPEECYSISYNIASTRSNFPSLFHANLMKQYQLLKPVNYRNFTNYQEIKTSTLAVNIYYDDILLTYINEVPSLSFVQYVANVGGYMSLCIGCSLLSLMEIVHSWIDMFKFFLCNKSRTPNIN